MRYVVIGAGPAGVTAVETLRAQDAAAEIVLIGGEAEPAYSRMAIPYLLSNQIEESGTYLRSAPDHLKRLGVEQIQAFVAAVDPGQQRLNLDNGTEVQYDRLLLATGSTPVKPPIDGLNQAGIHHCWTLEDARHIARLAQPGSRVVLMGAGFIGCIILEALVARGVDLTVVEMGDRMVPRMLDQTAGNLLKRWCMEKGVKVHTSTRVTGIAAGDEGSARFSLQIDPKGSILADLVVVATGVKPTTDYLAGSGIEVRTGVVVDRYQQTSVAGIYAAGDSCEGADWGSGESVVHAIQPVAVETARIAALNMCGRRAGHAGSMAMNVLDTLGLVSVSYGQWMGVTGGESAELLDERGFRYIKLQFEGECLIGAITLGMTQRVGVLRGLIQSRIRLGVWRQRLLQDPTQFVEAYLAATQPVS